MKREHTLTVGRYRVTGAYEAVQLEGGEVGMPSTELERLELQAAIAVLSDAAKLQGDELKFARKAIGLRQPDLAELLEVDVATISRWETDSKAIPRQTQLAVLLFVEHTLTNGEPPRPGKLARPEAPVRLAFAAA